MICLKLNEFLSLRIIDQKNINLRFSARNKNIKYSCNYFKRNILSLRNVLFLLFNNFSTNLSWFYFVE